jgi:hypothetical protein
MAAKWLVSVSVTNLPFLEHCVCYAHLWGACASGLLDLGRTAAYPLLGSDLLFPDVGLAQQLQADATQLLLELLCVPAPGHEGTPLAERTLGRASTPLAGLLGAGEVRKAHRPLGLVDCQLHLLQGCGQVAHAALHVVQLF